MATSATIREFREIIGDAPTHTFNEATADGINASWQLTNSPMVPASDSLFLNGVIQQNGTADTTTTAAISEGDDSFTVVSVSNLAVGQTIFLSTGADPQKFKILSISGTTVTVNRRFEQAFGGGVSVYIASLEYEVNNKYAIVYFDIAPTLGVKMTCHFEYTKYSDDVLNTLINQATREVGIDIGAGVDIENNDDHKTLVFLKAHITILDREVSKGASSAIKVKQGSTSLDLGGSVKALQNQLRGLQSSYQEALLRYLNNQLDAYLGEGVVGDEGYIA